MKVSVYLAKPVNSASLRLTLINVARGKATKIKADFLKTVATWETKPNFTAKVRAPQDSISVEISHDSPIYRMIDEGTTPHTILAPAGKTLRFRSKFKSKTVPRRIASRKGFAGGKWVMTKSVTHPGIVAREFSKVIGERWGPRLVVAARRAMREWKKKHPGG